jgi:hypothetical protein
MHPECEDQRVAGAELDGQAEDFGSVVHGRRFSISPMQGLSWTRVRDVLQPASMRPLRERLGCAAERLPLDRLPARERWDGGKRQCLATCEIGLAKALAKCSAAVDPRVWQNHNSQSCCWHFANIGASCAVSRIPYRFCFESGWASRLSQRALGAGTLGARYFLRPGFDGGELSTLQGPVSRSVRARSPLPGHRVR